MSSNEEPRQYAVIRSAVVLRYDDGTCAEKCKFFSRSMTSVNRAACTLIEGERRNLKPHNLRFRCATDCNERMRMYNTFRAVSEILRGY